MGKKLNTSNITKEQGDTFKKVFGWLVDIFVDKDEKSGKK